MKIKFIAFDIDGVIFDSSFFIEEAYSEAIDLFCNKYVSLSLKKPSRDEIIFVIGKTYKEIISYLFPYLPANYHEHFRSILLDILDTKIREKKGTLLPGTEEVISSLYIQGYFLGTASNGSQAYAEAVLQTYNLDKYFKEMKFVDFTYFNSKQDILSYYLKTYNLKNSELLMVGDRKVDLDAAKANNTYFCGIVGHGNQEEIIDSDFIIPSLYSLDTILNTI